MTLGEEERQSKLSVSVHLVAAMAMGWVSLTLSATYTKWLSALLGFAVLAAIEFAMEKVIGKKGIKWWLSNGAAVYLFIWVVTWIILFNLYAA